MAKLQIFLSSHQKEFAHQRKALKTVNEKLQPLVGEISWTKNVVIFQKCEPGLFR